MRLIDADKLKLHYAWWGSVDNYTSDTMTYPEAKAIVDTIIDLQPTIDIVRCGECRKSAPCDPSNPDMRYCVVHARRISADLFCSYGERPVEGESRQEKLERWQNELVMAREERWGG